MSLSAATGELAHQQHGVVCHTQLLQIGLSADQIQRWLERGRLRRLHVGIYALGHERLTETGRRLAAVLCFGPQAALSHRSAAVHWGLLTASRGLIDVSAPRAKTGSVGVRLHRPRLWEPRDRQIEASVPITTVPRTLIDLAGCVPYGVLESAANQAMTLELLDWDETQRSIGIAGRKRGIRRLRAILSELDPDRPLLTASYLEDQFLRIVRDFGLPRPESNVYIEGIKVDFVWRAKRLVVETDGDRFHSTVITRRNDRQRDRILQLAGYRVLRFDYNDVTKMPAGVATQVRSAFEIRRGLPNRT